MQIQNKFSLENVLFVTFFIHQRIGSFLEMPVVLLSSNNYSVAKIHITSYRPNFPYNRSPSLPTSLMSVNSGNITGDSLTVL